MLSCPGYPIDTATSSAVSTARTSGLEAITSSCTPWRNNDAPTSSASRLPLTVSGRSSSRTPLPSTAWAWRIRYRSMAPSTTWRPELDQRRPPAAVAFVRQPKCDHQPVFLAYRMHDAPERAGALAVDDAHILEAAGGAFVEIVGYQ